MIKRSLFGTTAALAMLVGIHANASIFDRDVDLVKTLTPAGEGFSAQLAREYRDFSMFESEQMYDWYDADYFAEKAFKASNGEMPKPEKAKFWGIEDPAHVRELDAARARLMNALDGNAANVAPRLAAVAQARYDCWVEQQEEAWQRDHIAACKTQFESAMNDLSAAMAPPPPPVAQVTPTPAPEPQKVAAAEPKLTAVTEEARVYFAFDKAELTPQAKRLITDFVNSIEDRSSVEVAVTGHADRAGPAGYNKDLSERRAEAVRQELISHGLRISKLKDFEIKAMGESEPAVATPDGVPEQMNRRVVLQGFGYVSDKLASRSQ